MFGFTHETPVTEEQVEWVDIVVVMEDEQRTELVRRFPEQYLRKKIISLADVYRYGRESWLMN